MTRAEAKPEATRPGRREHDRNLDPEADHESEAPASFEWNVGGSELDPERLQEKVEALAPEESILEEERREERSKLHASHHRRGRIARPPLRGDERARGVEVTEPKLPDHGPAMIGTGQVPAAEADGEGEIGVETAIEAIPRADRAPFRRR